jgi:hypothetical protein
MVSLPIGCQPEVGNQAQGRYSLSKEVSTMTCESCLKEKAHYHIVVENGVVVVVHYFSADGEGGRTLEECEYFVEYKHDK